MGGARVLAAQEKGGAAGQLGRREEERWAGGRGSLGRFGLRERREGNKKRLGLGQKEKGKRRWVLHFLL